MEKSPEASSTAFVPMTPHLESLRLRGPSEASAMEVGTARGSVQHSPAQIKEESRRVLTTISIVAVCYFAVSGGPIGSEFVVSAGGPLIGFIGLLLFPFIWGIPIAFITAELSSTFPEDGGYTVWVLNALGPFWAFQTGYWSWISGVIDNAIYPALAVSAFTAAYGSIGTPLEEYLVKAAIALLLALPNLLGVRIVGNGMAVLSLFVMVPFLALSVWGIVRGSDWSVLGEVRRKDIVTDDEGNFVSMSGGITIDWSVLVNTLFWNFNGAVSVSVFGGEVANPGRTYPRAMVISVVLIALTYLLPLLGATVYNEPHWTTWEDGSFASISEAIGGSFLSNWIVFATFCSNAGMYIAELFVDSFQILGMAECGLAPSFLMSICQVEIDVLPHAGDEAVAPGDTAPGILDEPVDAAVASTPHASADSGTVARSVHAPWRLKRLKTFCAIFALVGALAVGVAVVAYNVQGDDDGALSVSTPPPTQPARKTFLSLELAPDQASRFVLSKALWNRSFIVYPTIERHSGPPRAGSERGSILLDTTDNVFHFEMADDNQSLLLVSENHRARLKSGNDDLKRIFDDAHWPGYLIKVPIEFETDDAFYVPSYPFLSSGFFVTNTLWTDTYMVLPDGTTSYPRNAVLRVEYELEDGIAIVSYAIGLLPEKVMRQRAADDRVGYFSSRYTLYGSEHDPAAANTTTAMKNTDGFHYIDEGVTVLNRRRLEIDPATNKTKHPVVYYIDPSVPKRWRRAFAAGVEAWQPAFDAIGFKDAVRAVLPGDKHWPADYRLGDLRFNSISVMISDETYALGPSVVDPRSGEILHSDIIFEYGFFDDAVADFDQFSPVDPPASSSRSHGETPTRRSHFRVADAAKRHRGRLHQCGIGHHEQHKSDRMLLAHFAGGANGFVPDGLIGQHFTDVVMHEVGHTLGLRHNFAGSSMVSRLQLDDDAFVAKHGLSTSIMDYLPANIFADLTPAKARTRGYYMTTIGSYDRAAIAYGYAVVPDEKVPGAKSEGLAELARRAPFFLTDEDTDSVGSPFGQRFDLSSDPVAFANDRLDLAKVLRASNVVNKIPDDASWTALWRREASLLRMINKTMDSAWPVLGGVNVSHAHRHKGERKYTPAFVSRADQLRALTVLARIVRGERGLFPAPADYATYIEVRGGDWEDCRAPSLEYGCLARGLVDLDSAILYIKKKALSSALFPAMTRIVALDTAAPLHLTELLANVRNFTSRGDDDDDDNKPSDDSHATVLRAFLDDTLLGVLDDASTDVRVADAIATVFPDLVAQS
ncbi:hypothetical protein PybrP1_005437 [[Pythium] brassicae (nom. inval.)]|nr:hypothetical protein PybrP1_005437 [[Pythium] brassicae (nom. inval.)]